MKTIFSILFGAALLIDAHAASVAKFPAIALGGTTNQITDNGSALTRNGVVIGGGGGSGSTNWVDVGTTNATLNGMAIISGSTNLTAAINVGTNSLLYMNFDSYEGTTNGAPWQFWQSRQISQSTTRSNFVYGWGYNRGISGRLNTSQPSLGWSLETFYDPFAGGDDSLSQLEHYMVYTSPSGASYRLYAYNIRTNSNEVIWGTDSFTFNSRSAHNDQWLVFNDNGGTNMGGSVQLKGGITIITNGASLGFVQMNGGYVDIYDSSVSTGGRIRQNGGTYTISAIGSLPAAINGFTSFRIINPDLSDVRIQNGFMALESGMPFLDILDDGAILRMGLGRDTGVRRSAAGVVQTTDGGTTTMHLKTELIATGATAPTVASASTIAPTTRIAFVSGTTTIDTITAPSPISSTGGQITLIPTGLWSTSTSGNVALATTAVVSKALILTYDQATAKWYPSY